MRLQELLLSLSGVTLYGDPETNVIFLTDDSREVLPGALFAAMTGVKEDGTRYLQQAQERGAAAVLSHLPPPPGFPLPWIESSRERETFGLLCRRFYGAPDEILHLTGVTGTNGKTSITYILEALFSAFGRRTGVVGTIESRWGGRVEKASLTTPPTHRLFSLLRRMADDGVEDLFMEVSSHSMATERATALAYREGIFTNLTGDHLDYHQNMESYYRAKRKLFEIVKERGGKWVVNRDDPYGRRLLGELTLTGLSYGMENSSADVRAEARNLHRQGMEVEVSTPKGPFLLKSNLIGATNLSNLLAVTALALLRGYTPQEIGTRLGGVKIRIPGRMDRVENPHTSVYIDYAHSDDSLSKALETLRGLNFRKIIVVFGAGGDRDKTKRPRMGKAATEGADEAIITSDNPRTEDPLAIIRDVEAGAVGDGYAVIPDRREAIREAIRRAGPNDAVLVAGKGHEDYQILGTQKFHFSDFEEVERSLREEKGRW